MAQPARKPRMSAAKKKSRAQARARQGAPAPRTQRSRSDVPTQSRSAPGADARAGKSGYPRKQASTSRPARGEGSRAPGGADTRNPRGEGTRAPRGADTRNPRGEGTRAPRGADTRKPRGEGTRGPRATSVRSERDSAPRSRSAQGADTRAGKSGYPRKQASTSRPARGEGTRAPLGTDTRKPRGTDTRKPRSEDTRKPRGEGTRAPRATSARSERDSAPRSRSGRPEGHSERRRESSRPAPTRPPQRRSSTNERRNTPILAGGKSTPVSDDQIRPSAYAPDGFVSETAEVTSFTEAGVHPALVAALTAAGITAPFPIQSATLPLAIGGRDVLGRGQTGSGKTLAFGLAMLTNLAQSKPKSGRPMALVLSPTRELAMQSAEVLKDFGDAVAVRTQLIAGGMSYDRQITAIERGVHIIVATPGRLLDLVNRGSVDLSGVRITVLDEADQMADMGFLPDVRAILDLVKPNGQRMLFSATLDRGVDTIVDDYLDNPSVHAVDGGQASVSAMSHHLLVLNPGDKDEIVAQIGARKGKTIMFARSQLGADRIGEQLTSVGVPAGVLHGGKSQRVRNRTLEMFKSGKCRVLVATDVAARGIHVDDVGLVLQIDLPNNSKDYLHRAGRTARAGEAGAVVSLTTTRQRSRALALLKRADVAVTAVYVTPLSDELVEITGARQPTGRPWVMPEESSPAARRPRAGQLKGRRSGAPKRGGSQRSTGKGRPRG